MDKWISKAKSTRFYRQNDQRTCDPNPPKQVNATQYGRVSEPLTDSTKYQSLVESLLYINLMTRPNISLHVNLLQKQTSKPGINNMQTALQVGQYLASTKTKGLLITISQKENPEAHINIFIDASYRGENSRLQKGSLVTLYEVPVMWNSRRQDMVSMSIIEAEYIACSESAKDSQWIWQFLQEILPGMEIRTTLHTDNEPALKLTKT